MSSMSDIENNNQPKSNDRSNKQAKKQTNNNREKEDYSKSISTEKATTHIIIYSGITYVRTYLTLIALLPRFTTKQKFESDDPKQKKKRKNSIDENVNPTTLKQRKKSSTGRKQRKKENFSLAFRYFDYFPLRIFFFRSLETKTQFLAFEWQSDVCTFFSLSNTQAKHIHTNWFNPRQTDRQTKNTVCEKKIYKNFPLLSVWSSSSKKEKKQFVLFVSRCAKKYQKAKNHPVSSQLLYISLSLYLFRRQKSVFMYKATTRL